MTSERADRDVVATVPDVRQVLHGTDVDEHRRRCEPQLHERQQRVPAREELGVVAVLGQQRERLVGRPGPCVVEGGGDHAFTAWPDAASTAFTMLW